MLHSEPFADESSNSELSFLHTGTISSCVFNTRKRLRNTLRAGRDFYDFHVKVQARQCISKLNGERCVHVQTRDPAGARECRVRVYDTRLTYDPVNVAPRSSCRECCRKQILLLDSWRSSRSRTSFYVWVKIKGRRKDREKHFAVYNRNKRLPESKEALAVAVVATTGWALLDTGRTLHILLYTAAAILHHGRYSSRSLSFPLSQRGDRKRKFTKYIIHRSSSRQFN